MIWIALHTGFFWGVLAGSVLELAIIFASRWLWDRAKWMKWFSC